MSSSGRSSLFRDHQFHHNTHNFNHNQSFSSTLLEEIYRSFDNDDRREIPIPRGDGYGAMKKSSSSCLERENRFVINQWMQNDKINDINHSNKNNFRRAAAAAQSDGNSISRRSDHRRPMNHSSSTSSSDSSSGIGGFSSSDTESMYGSYSSKPKSKQQQPQPPLKPIRTTLSAAAQSRRESNYSGEAPAAGKKSNSKKEGNLHRRALKLYGDLKKVKQPISPGGKLATFLNSLFNAGASKKHHKFSSSSTASTPSISSNGHKLVRESSVASTPSTATAASRSCLSKTPSSAGRFERRSVRFVDDEQLGHRRNGGGGYGGGDVAKRDSSSLLANDEQFKFQLRDKHRKVEEAAKELLKNYHNRKELTINIVANDHKQHGWNRKFNNDVHIRAFEVEDEDEDEDDESCCSSDLFELENLLDGRGGGGVDGRYREELPVYETTHVGKNRAIANGYIL